MAEERYTLVEVVYENDQRHETWDPTGFWYSQDGAQRAADEFNSFLRCMGIVNKHMEVRNG